MMNQTEIGKFIAKCRKEKKLTQAQLAEKLNITDRAVSKWETGKSMPDSFNGFCKVVICYATINAWRDRNRRRQSSQKKRSCVPQRNGYSST